MVVIDGFTGAQVKDVDIEYEIGDSTVTILKNTFGMNPVTPTIIPTANINGIGINTISYDMSTKEVTVAINTSFSSASDVPFVVGDKERPTFATGREADPRLKKYNATG